MYLHHVDFIKVLRFHASATESVRRLQADSASSRITVSDCKSISHFVGMSRDVAFVMQFRDRECRRVRVAESRGHICARGITHVCECMWIRHFYTRTYIDRAFLSEHTSGQMRGENWKRRGLISCVWVRDETGANVVKPNYSWDFITLYPSRQQLFPAKDLPIAIKRKRFFIFVYVIDGKKEDYGFS